jgi:hypothetical protein
MARVLIPLLLVGLVLPSLLVGCNRTGSAEKEYNAAPRAAIPPLDVYVPPATETATFALG